MENKLKSWFDGVILNNLIQKGFGPFGYTMGSSTYPTYYSREAFSAFLLEMGFCHPKHHNRYLNGQGSELLETKTPPKMASVASSSRFAYLALRWGAEALGGTQCVEFEHECRIQGIRGTAPQLDAYTRDAQGNPILIEVKCHEIFDPHTIELSTAYWDLLYAEGNDFGLSPAEEKPTADKFQVPLSSFAIGKDHSMMDVKQLLCHLMGIASQKQPNQPATLVYLFFKPQATGEDKFTVERIFSELIAEMNGIFNSAPIRSFCRKHQIHLKALIEEAPVMERLTEHNIGYLWDVSYTG
jgi:hypothetical protein